jgi:hypothetical protein
MEENVTVIMRTVGERTEELCRRLILQQVPEENVITVSNTPFSAALADSYRAGIERGLKWTLCVDADVLLRPDAVATLLDTAEKSESNVCEVQGLVLDKFFGGSRPAGNHLYRTPLLPKALALIPKSGIDLRPEYYILQRMKKLGYSWIQSYKVLGLHDFEQYYRDIYRKCFVQAHKHDYRLDLFVSYWRRMKNTDPDFHIALIGLAAGIVEESQNVRIDSKKFPSNIADIVTDKNWEEKEEIQVNKCLSLDVNKIISEWKEPEEYINHFSSLYEKIKPKSKRDRFFALQKRIGTVRLIIWLFGWCLYKAGLKIKNWTNRK